jgi:excinuclease ABC subunit C
MMNLIKQEQLVLLDYVTSPGVVPETPGVYTFCDRRGTAIYVGKAKNLRRRVSGYLRQTNPYLEDRIRRMIHQARQLHIFETESELLALLLEDQLIKEHRPEFNIRQKDVFRHRYLAFSSGPYPALEIVEASSGRDPFSFGPYRDRYVAEAVREMVCKWFGLRSCPSPMPVRTCSYYDMQLCPGPCQALISPGDYSQLVKSAEAFLAGDETTLLKRMMESLRDHSRQLRFEKAAEIVRTMEFCHRLIKRQRFFRSFAAGQLVLYERGEREGTYRFSNGWLVDYLPEVVPRNDIPVIDVGESPEGYGKHGSDERFLVDRSNIIYSWINAHKSEYIFLPVP